MGLVLAFFDGSDHQWETRGSLRGWFTPEELSGAKPLPSQQELDRRECALEALINPED